MGRMPANLCCSSCPHPFSIPFTKFAEEPGIRTSMQARVLLLN